MSKPVIPLSIPYLNGNEKKYLAECIDTGMVSSVGPFVNQFEKQVAGYVGTPDAVATASGTAALHTALHLAGVMPDDEVIVPTITFIAPVNAVRYCGAHPIFMDADAYLNMDMDKVMAFLSSECQKTAEGVINRQTGRKIKAIIVVHVFGNPVSILGYLDLLKEWGIPIIEDATESLGSYYETETGKKQTGTVGDMGCFSFNGNKIITTGGGGIIVSKESSMLEKARYLTTQAKDDAVYFIHDEVGYNYRLTNIQAAVGVAQMEQLDQFIRIKRQNKAAYQARVQLPTWKFIPEPPQTHANDWHYGFMVTARAERDQLIAHLKTDGIEARPLWYLCHLQKPYQNCQTYRIEQALSLYDRIVNIPCSVSLSLEEIDQVAASIIRCYEQRN